MNDPTKFTKIEHLFKLITVITVTILVSNNKDAEKTFQVVEVKVQIFDPINEVVITIHRSIGVRPKHVKVSLLNARTLLASFLR